MIKTCPECDSAMSGNSCRVCGYKTYKEKQQDVACKWHTNGTRCQIGASIGHGHQDMYCFWHFECLNNPNMANDQKEFEDWCKRTFGYKCSHRQWKRSLGMATEQELEPLPKPSSKEVVWDENDMLIIKGLAFLGKNSGAWKHAPEACRKNAELYMMDSSVNILTPTVDNPFPVYEEDLDEERLSIMKENE
ncbi:MAG: hypothetical protein KBA02_00185 [Paludibacteraceae bacterium]|nr:hypothetical protein [Paludibacteraceae bacterium]